MTLDVRGSYFAVEDKRDYPALAISESDLKSVWSNAWWRDGKSDYLAGRPLIYFPELVVDSNSYGRFGVQNFWYQQPSGYSAHARLTVRGNADPHAQRAGR